MRKNKLKQYQESQVESNLSFQLKFLIKNKSLLLLSKDDTRHEIASTTQPFGLDPDLEHLHINIKDRKEETK